MVMDYNCQLECKLELNVKQTLKEALDQTGHCFEWANIKQDLKSLQEITIE